MSRKQMARWDFNLLALLSAVAIALGYLDAVVAVYVRRIAGISPLDSLVAPQTLDQLPDWLLALEQTRSAAMLLLLIATAMLIGHKPAQKLAVLLFVGGMAKLCFYASVKALAGWPASLVVADWPLRIVACWQAPVWIVLVAAVVMVALALLLLRLLYR